MNYLVLLTDVIDVVAVFYSAKRLTLVKWTIKSDKNTKTVCSNNVIFLFFFWGGDQSRHFSKQQPTPTIENSPEVWVKC